MSINHKSVRFRTAAAAALALAVVLGVTGVVLNSLLRQEIRDSFDQTLQAQAADRAAQLAAGADPQSLMTVSGEEVIVVALSQNNTILASAGIASPSEVIGLPVGVSDQTLGIIEDGEVDQHERLRVAVAQGSDGSIVVVGNEDETARAAVQTVRAIVLTTTPLLVIAGASLAWLFVGRALRPVVEIGVDLNQLVHAGDGQRVREPDSEDEIGELAETINEVLDRLEHQADSRRRFVADASHELKSPVANLRALIETSDTDPELGEALLTEAGRLAGLVDDLLFLAEADELSEPRSSRFDLDDLVFREAERVAATSAKSVDASGVVPVQMAGDRREVAKAVRNLVENCERFAESVVTIQVVEQGPSVTISVADDGPGVPRDQRQKVFERFARVEGDRGRGSGGTGLGLAIVATVAERHGGSVSVSESPSGGALFELTLLGVEAVRTRPS